MKLYLDGEMTELEVRDDLLKIRIEKLKGRLLNGKDSMYKG